jgi:hypothetical protein
LKGQDDEIGLRIKCKKLRFARRLLRKRGGGQKSECECTSHIDSILRRPLDVINYKKFAWCSGGFEFQPELLLQCFKDR